jgi:hypothetical protein
MSGRRGSDFLQRKQLLETRMKGYRTLLFSLAVAVVGVLQSFDWASIIAPEQAGVALTVVGVIGAALRFLTSTPVGSSE